MTEAVQRPSHQEQDWETQFLDGSSIDEDLAQFGEDELIVNALKVGGGDLLQYARKLEADLRRKETEAIEDYVKQTVGHLKVFEETLINFQNDLGHVGGQIKDMNARAQALDTLASNRRQAEAALSTFIHGGSLPKRLAKAVHEEPVGPSYVPLLRTLDAKRAFFADERSHAQAALAGHVVPVLDRLQAQALERITAALGQRVKALPYQQHASFKADPAPTAAEDAFCALGPCASFLRRHSPEGYAEIRDKYVETMRGALAVAMRAVEREVSRYQVEVLKHGDTLFSPGPSRGLRAMMSKGGEVLARGALRGAKKDGDAEKDEVKLEVFELSERMSAVALVEEPEAVAFDPAEEHVPEVSFGAAVAALISNMEAQQRVVQAVFPAHPPDIMLSLLQPALQSLEEWAAASVRESMDPVSLLLCIRILQAAHDKVERLSVRHMPSEEDAGEDALGAARKSDGEAAANDRAEEEEGAERLETEAEGGGGGASGGGGGGGARDAGGRGVEAEDGRRGGGEAMGVVSEMEGLFSGLFMAVWPRFKAAIEAQVESLKTAGGSASMPAGSDKAVHSITTRYAQLTAGLLVIFAGLHSQSALMASTSITYMCQSVEKFVQRGGETLGGGLKHAFFAINQYDHILAVYHLTGVKASQCAPMRALLHAHTDGLLPLLLGQAYKEMEEAVAAARGGSPLQEKLAKKLAEDFAKGYATAFSKMHESIAGSVCSATLCIELHKKAACQLLLTYGAFRDIVEQQLAGSVVCGHLIAEEALIEEIKKYDNTANFLDA